MKMTKYLKTEEGKWSKLKIIPIGAIVSGLIIFALTTAYHRYEWIRDQCYKVATNEKLVIKTGEDLHDKDISLQKQINALRDDLELKSGILHQRVNDEAKARDAKDVRLEDLIIDMLKGQREQINIQREQLKKDK